MIAHPIALAIGIAVLLGLFLFWLEFITDHPYEVLWAIGATLVIVLAIGAVIGFFSWAVTGRWGIA